MIFEKVDIKLKLVKIDNSDKDYYRIIICFNKENNLLRGNYIGKYMCIKML